MARRDLLAGRGGGVCTALTAQAPSPAQLGLRRRLVQTHLATLRYALPPGPAGFRLQGRGGQCLREARGDTSLSLLLRAGASGFGPQPAQAPARRYFSFRADDVRERLGCGPLFTIKAGVLGLQPVCCPGMAPPGPIPLRRIQGGLPPPAACNRCFCRPAQPGRVVVVRLQCMFSLETPPLPGWAPFAAGGCGGTVSLAGA